MEFRIKQQADAFKDNTQGAERVKKHSDSVQMALAKILRKSSGHLNKRDEVALEDLLQNFQLYLTCNMSVLDQVNRIYKRQSDIIAQE